MTEAWDPQENRRINMVVLLTLLSYLVGSIVIQEVKNTALQLVLIQAFCLLPGFVYMIRFSGEQPVGKTFSDLYRVRKVRLSAIFLPILIMLFLMPLLTFVNLISQQFTNYVASEDIMDRIQDYPFWVSLLCVGIVPAVGEELTYRGLMYGQYRKRSVLMGALLSGLLFGLMHGNLNQMAYALLMGIVFALVDEASGSTVSSMIMHALVNSSSVAIIYLVKWFNITMEDSGEFTTATVIGYGVTSAIGVWVAYHLYRELAFRCGTEKAIVEEVKKPGRIRALRDMFSAPLALAIILLVALLVAAEMMLLK